MMTMVTYSTELLKITSTSRKGAHIYNAQGKNVLSAALKHPF
jgi:hypothetical protein